MKTSMKRLLALLMVAAMVVLSVAGCSSKKDEPAADPQETTEETPAEEGAEPAEAVKDFEGAELVVATWGWTAANVKELSAAFEQQYNCTVVIDETSGNADRLNKIMAQQSNPEMDVALMSESFAVKANQEGLFEKIDTAVVTNLDNLYDFAKNADGFGPCYSVVRYGIIYDADAVAEAPTSYMDLFSGKYNGQLSLPDMATTAGPYLLVALAEAQGGSQEDVDAAFKLLADNKDNVAQFYTTSSDVQTGFTTGEIAVSVFMDMNVPTLQDAEVNAQWVEPTEGCFSAAATINVIKNCPNPELAQLYVQYMLSDETQSQVADKLSEAPTSRNATMPEAKQAYLAFGEDAVANLRKFDDTFIDTVKADWIERFQREVTI
jgi:Spermidine/putrescine-binding periplasmic protein